MNKEFLKTIIHELGLSQVGFARKIGVNDAALRRMLMPDTKPTGKPNTTARPISPYVEAEALSLLAHHRKQLPEWTVGMDADHQLEVTTIHHNIYPRFTAFIGTDMPSGVSMDAGGEDDMGIVWHSHVGGADLDFHRDWMKRALAAESCYNTALQMDDREEDF